MSRKTILLSAGDDSGDLHASNLMRAIRAQDPDVDFLGLGMSRMVAAGLEPLAAEHERGSAMWFHNLLRIGDFRRRLALCEDAFRTRRPDLVLLVDYGGVIVHIMSKPEREFYQLEKLWAEASLLLRVL